MKNNRGFTLVELLAVIVILAVILAIAIPRMTDIVSNAKKNSLESNAKMIIKAVNYKLAQDPTYDVGSINESNIASILGIDAANIKSVTLKKANNEIYVTVVGQNDWQDLTVSGTLKTTQVGDTVTTLTNGANKPVLVSGMTPIKWNGSAWVNTTEDDTNWYNYDTTNKVWANAKTADGSMWVWIPRYIYKITSNHHVKTTGTIDIQFSKGVADNWNSAVIGNINLGETSAASNNTWTNHPAFTFGSTEVTGIWVAKFEATAAEGVANGYTADGWCLNSDDNDSDKTIKIVNGVQSWRCLYVGNSFVASRNMEKNNTYGWGTTGSGIDTHLIKNVEWGAVVYLAKSSYGKTTEITANGSSDYYTGGGTGTAYVTNVAQSSTGNIFGVYDLHGGSDEWVASYVDNDAEAIETYGSAIRTADAKYKDVYAADPIGTQAAHYALTVNKKGDAMWETSENINGYYAWFNNFTYMPVAQFPWPTRGQPFNICPSFADKQTYIGFRPVLLIASGL